MKVPYVSITNATQDWYQDNDLTHEEVNVNLLTKWAVDCVRWCSTPEQLTQRIGVFQVENSRFRLPDDFVMVCQAASNIYYEPPCMCDVEPKPDCCGKKSIPKYGRIPKTRREDIVQWVQGTMGEECELEINLNCKACHNTPCACDTPIVEVDVDRIWEMAHPEIYYGHMNKIGRFGYGPGHNGPYQSYYNPEFKLMRYSTNDYHKLQYMVTDCPNVNCDNCWREFTIDLPYMEVDFDKGEVLLSYLGRPLDGDGEIMIPDHPDIFEAIVNHLDYKYYRMMYKKSNNPHDDRKSQMAMQLREDHIGKAKAELDIPIFHQFKNYLESSSMLKRVPGWSSDYAGKRTPDVGRTYGDMLDGRNKLY